jgi:hypothetical protein
MDERSDDGILSVHRERVESRKKLDRLDEVGGIRNTPLIE